MADGEARTATVIVRVTESQRAEMEAAAEARGQRMSEWIRESLLKALSRERIRNRR